MYRTHVEITKTVFGKLVSLTLHARKTLLFNGDWFVPFRYSVLSPGVMARRKDEKKKKQRHAEKRNSARRKDEIMRSATPKDEKQVKKRQKTSYEITPFKALIFRLLAWLLFIISSFRLTLFRLFVVAVFLCVASFSLIRLFAWRYSVFSPCHNASRKDEVFVCLI